MTWRIVPAVLAFLLTTAACAQTYPARPIRFIVPNPAGGGADTTARMIAVRLAERFNQPVIVDNRPGAGGTIGLATLAKAPPDGYTIGMGVTATLAISPAIYTKLAYDPDKDFSPISLFTSAPLLLVVQSSSDIGSVSDLVKLAKAQPRKLTYSSPGNGTPPHLSAELFRRMTDIQIVHVPYKGAPAALTALIAGEATFMFGNMLPTLPHLASGRLRPLAVTSLRRSPALAGVPSLDESGVPGYESVEWYGVVAPAGTPRAIVARLATEIARIAHLPELKEQFQREATEPVGSTPEQFAAFIKQERDKWGKVAKESHARVD